MVVHGVRVDAEQHRVLLGQRVGPEKGLPLDLVPLEDPEEVAADVGHRPSHLDLPLVALPPVALDLVPEPDGREAEAGVGLSVAVALVLAYGGERSAVQQLPTDRSDRERITVQEEEQVVGRGAGGGDDAGELVELLRVLALEVEALLEDLGPARVDAVQAAPHLELLGEVAAQEPALRTDPAIVHEVDGDDVNHGGRPTGFRVSVECGDGAIAAGTSAVERAR